MHRLDDHRGERRLSTRWPGNPRVLIVDENGRRDRACSMLCSAGSGVLAPASKDADVWPRGTLGIVAAACSDAAKLATYAEDRWIAAAAELRELDGEGDSDCLRTTIGKCPMCRGRTIT